MGDDGMKIVSDSNSVYYNNPNTNISRRGSVSDGFSNVKSFDEVSIHKSDALPEAKFVNELKNKIMNDIKKSHSEKELEELKLQIEDGSYQIGIDEIIRKILL